MAIKGGAPFDPLRVIRFMAVRALQQLYERHQATKTLDPGLTLRIFEFCRACLERPASVGELLGVQVCSTP
jgi:hypothetical protein